MPTNGLPVRYWLDSLALLCDLELPGPGYGNPAGGNQLNLARPPGKEYGNPLGITIPVATQDGNRARLQNGRKPAAGCPSSSAAWRPHQATIWAMPRQPGGDRFLPRRLAARSPAGRVPTPSHAANSCRRQKTAANRRDGGSAGHGEQTADTVARPERPIHRPAIRRPRPGNGPNRPGAGEGWKNAPPTACPGDRGFAPDQKRLPRGRSFPNGGKLGRRSINAPSSTPVLPPEADGQAAGPATSARRPRPAGSRAGPGRPATRPARGFS